MVAELVNFERGCTDYYALGDGGVLDIDPGRYSDKVNAPLEPSFQVKSELHQDSGCKDRYALNDSSNQIDAGRHSDKERAPPEPSFQPDSEFHKDSGCIDRYALDDSIEFDRGRYSDKENTPPEPSFHLDSELHEDSNPNDLNTLLNITSDSHSADWSSITDQSCSSNSNDYESLHDDETVKIRNSSFMSSDSISTNVSVIDESMQIVKETLINAVESMNIDKMSELEV